MSLDVAAWKGVIKQVVGGLADEAAQRRAWFGTGPEVSSPDDDFCAFFGDVAIEDFLERDDAGLTAKQREAGLHLVSLMRALARETPTHIDPAQLIDDPRWQRVREAAARFSASLSERV